MSQFQQYNVYDGLTAARVVSTANIAGTYFNGQTNNGVGATFTVTATGVLTIDSVAINSGDSVLLVGQTAANQNGLYIVSNPGATGIQPVLTRRADFQNIEQIRAGQFVTVAAGTVNNGTIWSVVEPLPGQFGISNIVFVDSSGTSGTFGTAAFKAASNNALASVSSVNGTTTANTIAVFADAVGTVQNQAKANGTEAANAVTASGQAGVITTSALTTAGAGSYAITWTNTFIAPGSTILLSIMGGTNTTKNITMQATAGTGTSTLTIYNNTAATALNGTVIIGYQVI
jgi:hypothetical protein